MVLGFLGVGACVVCVVWCFVVFLPLVFVGFLVVWLGVLCGWSLGLFPSRPLPFPVPFPDPGLRPRMLAHVEKKAGKPIVSFCARPAKEFLAALAQIVTFLTVKACPHCKHYNDAIQIWKDLHIFLDTLAMHEPPDMILSSLRIHNQDLAGFSSASMLIDLWLLCSFYCVGCTRWLHLPHFHLLCIKL